MKVRALATLGVLTALAASACSNDTVSEVPGTEVSGTDSTAPDLTATDGAGLLLYVPVAEEGGPTSELVVVAADGAEQRRIELPELTRGGGNATRYGSRAILQGESGAIYLVDAMGGTVQELDIPPDVGLQLSLAPAGFRAAGGERWIVLASAAGDRAYLADLETGQATSLLGGGESQLALSGRFSPDGVYLALTGVPSFLLIPTGSPSEGRSVDGSPVEFSHDGRRIVYVRRGNEVVVEAVDGSSSEVVLTSDEQVFLFAVFGPSGEQLAVVEQAEHEERLFVLDLGRGTQEQLLAWDGSVVVRHVTDRGSMILGVRRDGLQDWHWIDLVGGRSESLDSLAGFSVLPFERQHRWMMFAGSSGGESGFRVIGLDLDTGATQELMAVDYEMTIAPLGADASDDGRMRLLTGVVDGTSRWQLWLLGAGMSGRMLAEAGGVRGALSPDGRSVAVSTFEGEGDGVVVTLSLLSSEGGARRDLSPGFVGPWVHR